MFESLFEDLHYPIRLVALAACAAVLALISPAPDAGAYANHVRPGGMQSSSLSNTLQSRSFGSLSTRTQNDRTRRRTWMVRFGLFELRVDRESRHGSDSWSVTILTDESENGENSTSAAVPEKCI